MVDRVGIAILSVGLMAIVVIVAAAATSFVPPVNEQGTVTAVNRTWLAASGEIGNAGTPYEEITITASHITPTTIVMSCDYYHVGDTVSISVNPPHVWARQSFQAVLVVAYTIDGCTQVPNEPQVVNWTA